MIRNISFVFAAAALIFVGAASVGAQGPAEKAADQGKVTLRTGGHVERLPAPRITAQRDLGEGTGTIQYDNGTATGTLSVASVTVGNQFDTSTIGPVQTSGTISAVTISMAAANTSVFLSIYDQVAGTGANVVTSASVPMSPGLNTINGPWNYVGSTFLAGGWHDGSPVTDLVAIGTGTTGGQGFHGMTINDIVATGFSRPGTFNAIVRASGNVVVPVELMEFSVSDE